MKLHYENATGVFLRKLRGVIDPERKRKIIGRAFASSVYDAFQKATMKAGAARFLAQGTTYPDVIESVSIARQSRRHDQVAPQCRRPAKRT